MLLVEVELKEAYRIAKDGSSVCIGVGIFAKKDIPKDTFVYAESPFAQWFTAYEVSVLPECKKAWMHKYATFHKDKDSWHLCTDDARNWNHSDDANCLYPNEESGYMAAVRDIKAGEELTCNYREFCDKHKEGFDFEILSEIK